MTAAAESTSTASFCLPKTRVRGIPDVFAPRIGSFSWVSSTSRWASTPVYDGTASGKPDQLYYSPGWGRFMTSDPYLASAEPSDPGSWNRYVYVQGDPVDSIDPSGLGPISAPFSGPYCPPNMGQCIQIGPTTADLYNSSGLAVGGPVSTGTTTFNTTSPDMGTAELGYVTETVIPGYLGAFTPPTIESGNWISGSQVVSTTITYSPPITAVQVVSAFSVSLTFSLGSVGAALGGAIAGPLGVFPGYALGSMVGVGPSFSYDRQSGAIYAGVVATLSPGLNSGTGQSITGYTFEPGQSVDGTLNGWSGGMNYQPFDRWVGSTVMQSPGQDPVVGVTVGTRVPVAISGGYSVCVFRCP